MGCNKITGVTWCLAIGGALFVLLGAITLTVIIGVVDKEVAERTYLGYEMHNGSKQLNEMTVKWIKPPYIMQLQVYIYHVKNPIKVISGAKPIVDEIGPFSFREEMVKDYEFIDNGTKVIYNNTHRYFFDKDTSCAQCSLDTIVTIPNIVFQKLMDALQSSIVPSFLRELIIQILAKWLGETVFITVKAREALFEGYSDPLLSKVCSRLPSFCEEHQFPDRVGFFYGQNNTNDGTYVVATGLNDRELLGKIYSWNNMTILPESWWSTSDARMINGTDGQLFPPLLNANEDRVLFAAQACRTVKLRYQHTTSVDGVPVFKYGVPDSLYDSTLPENRGFCQNDTPVFFNDTKVQPTGCLPTGLLDLSHCQPGNPAVYISQAHFLSSPKELRDAVIGIRNPNKQDDSTTVEIEPTSGAVVRAKRRAQINVGLIKRDGLLKNMSALIMPVLWINETAYFDYATRKELHDELWKTKHLMSGIGFSLLFFGVVCWLAFIGYFIVKIFCALPTADEEDPLLDDTIGENIIPTPTDS